MENIITAEKFYEQHDANFEMLSPEFCFEMMREFAKFHCEEQAKVISEKANMIGETQHLNNAPDDITDFVYVSDSNGPDYGYRINKDSILNAYPLSNIN